MVSAALSRPDLRLLTTPGNPVRSARAGTLRAVPSLPEADDFDRLLDDEARRLSLIHWTPATVCRRAAELLALAPGERVLDVGAGIGKLCLLGSVRSEGQFVGIEQRAPLVATARSLAARLGSTATFILGDAFDVAWSGYAALYFYNPFDEARFPSTRLTDGTIATGPQVFDRLVASAQQRLSELPAATRVVVFHGIGGPMPECYRLDLAEKIGDGTIERWIRR